MRGFGSAHRPGSQTVHWGDPAPAGEIGGFRIVAVIDTTQSVLASSQQRPPIWRNSGVLKWVAQIVVLLLVLGAFWFLGSTAIDGLAAKNLTPSYEFIDGPANIQPSEGIDTAPSSAGRLLWVGMVTTLQVAIVGVILSTILGVLVGLARLSNNWLANRAASFFIETLRNIPVLVQIFLWFYVMSNTLPDLEAGEGRRFFILSQKGVSIPRIFYDDGFYQWLAFIALGIVPIVLARRYFNARQAAQGGQNLAGPATLAILAVFAIVGWFANSVMSFLGGIFGSNETAVDRVNEGGIAGAWQSIPQSLMQLLLTLAVFGLAIGFIIRFLNSRRTPAGLAKLTDDDYFRMIFAVVAAAFMTLVFWVLWPGLSSWIINSGSDFWGWLGDKFGDDRGTRPLDGMLPTVSDGRFANYGPTGATLTVFRAALLVGLVLYTASFIAEIVRGGILAVAKGQTEAAAALGLSRSQALRKVILPQAFRVIMPPLGNQYLNITKNTSLAIAVGLSDVVQVGQSVFNKNGQSLAVFTIWMAFFLACSLTISVIVNFINGRLEIVER